MEEKEETKIVGANIDEDESGVYGISIKFSDGKTLFLSRTTIKEIMTKFTIGEQNLRITSSAFDKFVIYT